MDTQDGMSADDELLLTDVAREGEDAGLSEPIDEYPSSFDDEPDEAETPLIKQMREKAKEDAREKAEMRRKLDDLEKRATPVVTRTKKPDLFDDCEGDPDRFETALLAWKDNERKAEEAEQVKLAPPASQVEEWRNAFTNYRQGVEKLGKPDFKAAEDAVCAALTDDQQRAVVIAVKDPARFIDALGRSPHRLAQLAQISNPIRLGAEAARIEGARVMPRKDPANIDTPLRGNARLSNAPADAQEAKLEKEAERTGDRDALRAYRKQKAAKAA